MARAGGPQAGEVGGRSRGAYNVSAFFNLDCLWWSFLAVDLSLPFAGPQGGGPESSLGLSEPVVEAACSVGLLTIVVSSLDIEW